MPGFYSDYASAASVCDFDVTLTGCPNFELTRQNGCEGSLQVITFRYAGGDCSRSENIKQRQKFNCEDFNGGPPTTTGDQNYITVVDAKGKDVYFDGPVAVSEEFTLNENKDFDKLSAMTINVFASRGGTLLQTTNLHLSCIQDFFPFDRFGSSSVTSWIETSGRDFSQIDPGTITPKVTIETPLSPIRLTEAQFLSSVVDNTIDFTPTIAGQVLGPGVAVELEEVGIDIDLGFRVSYTFFITVIGESLDGTKQCSNFADLECVEGFN